MSKEVVISVENVSKLYRLGTVGTGTLSHDLKRWLAMARGKEDPYLKIGSKNDRSQKADSDYSWAIKDVSFDVEAGDTIGVIGKNGAGKSTLLKILSKVTSPTTGQIRLKGRIASLLEVGTGFHPELTGRENTYMNGAILGMTKKEINAKFDEIVNFSGVERYIDTPVKRYSSGMYVRLAFAIAAFLEPEILIVDEVLAVGDIEFQKKCLGRMKDVSTNDGRTVIFVSHNMSAVQALCNKAVMLEHGTVKMIGECSRVINHYMDANANMETTREWTQDKAPGDDDAKIMRIELVNAAGQKVANSFLEEEVFVKVHYRCLTGQTRLNLSISLITDKEECLLSSPSLTDTVWCGVPHPEGDYVSYCKMPADFFNDKTFQVSVLLVKNGTEVIAYCEHVIALEKIDSGKNRGNYFGAWTGLTRPRLEWRTEKIS